MSRSLVNQATADDESPPGGYVMQELAKLTHKSREDAADVADALLGKLDRSSPDVRRKALICIKYVAQHGREEFRVACQSRAALLRENQHFRGPLDALRGDAPYVRVREAATDALDAIYNATQRPAHLNKPMSGFGNTPALAAEPAQPQHQNMTTFTPTFYTPESAAGSGAGAGAGAGSGGAAGPRVMQGFGNTDYRPSPVPAAYQRFQGPGPYQGAEAPQSAVINPAPATAATQAPRKRGQVGGVWASEGAPAAAHGGAGAGGGAAAGASASAHAPANGGYTYAAAAAAGVHAAARQQAHSQPQPHSHPQRGATAGVYERKMVDEITPEGGVRPMPTQKELTDFLQKARTVDQSLLASLLDAKMSGKSNQAQSKAAAVVEAMVQGGLAPAIEYFQSHPDVLRALEASENRIAAQKAQAVLGALGLRTGAPTSSAASAAASAAAPSPPPPDSGKRAIAPLIDLIAEESSGFAFMDSAPSAAPAAAPQRAAASSASATSSSSAAAAGGGDLFSAMQVRPLAAAPVAPVAHVAAPLVAAFAEPQPQARARARDPADLLGAQDLRFEPVVERPVDHVARLIDSRGPQQGSAAAASAAASRANDFPIVSGAGPVVAGALQRTPLQEQADRAARMTAFNGQIMAMTSGVSSSSPAPPVAKKASEGFAFINERADPFQALDEHIKMQTGATGAPRPSA